MSNHDKALGFTVLFFLVTAAVLPKPDGLLPLSIVIGIVIGRGLDRRDHQR